MCDHSHENVAYVTKVTYGGAYTNSMPTYHVYADVCLFMAEVWHYYVVLLHIMSMNTKLIIYKIPVSSQSKMSSLMETSL